MRPIQRRTFLQGAAAGTAALGFPYIARGQDKTLVVNSYGPPFEDFMRAEIIPPFEEQTGIRSRSTSASARAGSPSARGRPR